MNRDVLIVENKFLCLFFYVVVISLVSGCLVDLICSKFSSRQVAVYSALGKLGISHLKSFPWTEVLLKQYKCTST